MPEQAGGLGSMAWMGQGPHALEVALLSLQSAPVALSMPLAD